jgi:hypothetical protein
MDAKALIQQGDMLFGKRGTLMMFWQETAEQLYPERADFTVIRTLGTNYADNLSTSYPVILRRELGDLFSTMLRPTALSWFQATTDHEDQEDHSAKQWLEAKSKVMRRAMYDPESLFTEATKEGDHDFAAFGNAVITVEMDPYVNKLLYRCWHLRDVAWANDIRGKLCTVHRKWKSTPAEQVKTFPGKVHPKVQESVTGPNPDPYRDANVRHIVMEAADYQGEFPGKGRRNVKYVSIFIDTDNNHVIEVTGQTYMMYVIPRWQTVSGSQYGFSPAASAGLPEARLLQAMTATLLEAGEKATNPPMIGVGEALRSDLALYAGGFTSIDADYDESTGEAIRSLPMDKNGLPFGFEMAQDIRSMVKEAFYLNKLTMPQNGPEMTAYEVGQRIQEFIRGATPVFEPVEANYNGAICDTTFDLLLSWGAFGPTEEIPDSLRGADINFRFESPLHDAIEKQKAQQFVEVKGVITDTLALDPNFDAQIDVTTAGRDVLSAIAPAKWMRSEEDAQEIIDGRKQQQEAQQLIETINAGATAAEQVGKAGQALGPEALAAA